MNVRGGFLTLLLAGEQERVESLYGLGVSIVEDKIKHVWEKEIQLATEYQMHSITRNHC